MRIIVLQLNKPSAVQECDPPRRTSSTMLKKGQMFITKKTILKNFFKVLNFGKALKN
jgi:hypothetical protein